MKGLPQTILSFLLLFGFAACDSEKKLHERPLDPWVFRSVLDQKPRMLTIALDSACYVAYDLATSTLYKAWKGGVLMEGTAYTDKKNVQPTSWGTPYPVDSVQWVAEKDGADVQQRLVNKGYYFDGN